MTNTTEKLTFREFKIKHKEKFNCLAMFIHMNIVYIWSLRIWPLGRDYAFLAEPGEGVPKAVGAFLNWEIQTFGANVIPYHLTNMAIMYACMLCLYFFVRKAVQGVSWLGTLAAVMFMANPVHSEAMLNLSGAQDLLPCLFALAALLAYSHASGKYFCFKLPVAMILFVAAVVPFEQNAFLGAVLVLYELLVNKGSQRWRTRLFAAAIAATFGIGIHIANLSEHGLALADMFAPLYFILYPIGFLPETARTFHESPWLAWLAAATVILLTYLACKKAKRGVVLFGILAAIAVRFFQSSTPIDPVHMVGGGQLLLSNALLNVALCGIFLRIMDHKQWRKPIVWLTTLACVVLFAMQIRSITAWNFAGQYVKGFQETATEMFEKDPTEAIAICPDYQYYSGAPIKLSEAVSFDTPFSKAIPTLSLLKINAKPGQNKVTLSLQNNKEAKIVIEGSLPIDITLWPYSLSRKDGVTESEQLTLKTLSSEEDGLHLQLKLQGDANFPARYLPQESIIE